MAKMQTSFDPQDVLGGLMKMANSDTISKKMVDAGLDVMANAIKVGASSHRKTGHMANSIGKTTPTKNKDGDIVGRVKFMGSEGVTISKKSGKRFDRTNWIKAFRIEYGTSKQTAHPFVRPAIQRSKSAISSAMQKVFEEETKQ